MPRVTVVIPYRDDGQERAAALDYVLGRYRREYPSWPVLLGTCPPGPWSKGTAVAHATRSTTADILIVADADVWTTGLKAAVQAVTDGASWAMPHTLVKRLTNAATASLIAGRETEALDEPAYPGMPGGGITVLPRTTYRAYPIDPRFQGWGQEDECFGRVLEAVLGDPWRGTTDLIHLWHPPAPRLSRSRGNPDGWRLRRRYLKARWTPAELDVLLKEGRDALNAHQPALHHPATRDDRRDDAIRSAA